MTTQEDAVKNHPVHAELVKLDKLLRAFKLKDLDEGAADQIKRARRVVSFLKDLLNLVDPVLTPVSSLNAIQQQLPNAVNQLNTYQSNKNVGHLNNATNHLDTALTHSAQFPLLKTKDMEPTLMGLIDQFRERADEFVERLEARLSSYDARFEKISTDAERLSTRLGELGSQIDSEKQRVDTVATDFQNSFRESEDARGKKFDERVDRWDKTFATTNQAMTNKAQEVNVQLDERIGEHETKFIEKSKEIIIHLEELEKQASKLVGVIGATGLTAKFKETADTDEDAADKMRKGAIWLFMGMIITIVAIVVISYWVDTAGYKDVLLRLGAVLAFGVPAGYLAHESSKHRENARRNRRIQVELTALGPFIETLDEDTKKTIRAELADKFFGQNDQINIDDVESLPAGPMTEIIKLFVNALKK